MKMQPTKIHSKNSFEYKCDRIYVGYSIVYWYFRPVGEEIFIQYNSSKEKTVKKDMEYLLSSPSSAHDYYYSALRRESDVEAAEVDLREARKYWERVHSPNFDLRGNNPNAEERVRKKADEQLSGAENRLERAIRYKTILERQSNIA